MIGGLHGPTRHFFCPHCMSWLFTRPEGMDEFVNVRATMLNDARSHRPFIETYTGEALPWAKTPAVQSFESSRPWSSMRLCLKSSGSTRTSKLNEQQR